MIMDGDTSLGSDFCTFVEYAADAADSVKHSQHILAKAEQ